MPRVVWQTSRNIIGEFEFRAQAVIVASGGIGGNHDLVRRTGPNGWAGCPSNYSVACPRMWTAG